MPGASKYLLKIGWPALLSALLLLSACENDLKKIQQLSANQLNMDVDTIHGVDIIYSDSAKVKFRVTAPLLLQYQGKKPYDLMPKTVNVAVFENLIQTGSIVADTGIHSNIENKIQFRKNVVAKNEKGETFKSDELIWDQNTKTIRSSKIVQIRLANGDIMNGTGFLSDDKMNHWTVQSSTGIFNVTDAPNQ